MVDVVKGSFDVRVYDPLPLLPPTQEGVQAGERVMAASSGTESVARCLKPGFPGGFERVLDHRLEGTVANRRDAERALLPVGLRYVHPFGGLGSPRLIRAEFVHQLAPGGGGLHEHLIDASGSLALIHLRYPPHGMKSVGTGTQHELLQRADSA